MVPAPAGRRNVGAEPAHRGVVLGAGEADHPGAGVVGELGGEAADAAVRPLDEDGLAGGDLLADLDQALA